MLALVIAALTHLVYPVIYHLVLQADIVAIAALATRNVLVVLLGAWAVARLARTPTTLRRRSHARRGRCRPVRNRPRGRVRPRRRRGGREGRRRVGPAEAGVVAVH